MTSVGNVPRERRGSADGPDVDAASRASHSTLDSSCLPLAKLQFHLKGKLKLTVIFFSGLEGKAGKQASLEDASRW